MNARKILYFDVSALLFKLEYHTIPRRSIAAKLSATLLPVQNQRRCKLPRCTPSSEPARASCFVFTTFIHSVFVMIAVDQVLSLFSNVFASMDDVKTAWKNADAVCFDVDSTVIESEAIDELAAFCGKAEQVKEITKSAMTGKVEFREALAARLKIISPTLMQVREFLKQRPFKLTKNVKELIYKLHERRTPVHLVSGGFRVLIGPIATELNIPAQNIYANRLKFYFNGDYAGFDEKEFTSQSCGKAKVIQELKSKFKYNKVVMIGDGMTDAEASPPADAFIGFGGNVVREEVKARSGWYVTDFQELINALEE